MKIRNHLYIWSIVIIWCFFNEPIFPAPQSILWKQDEKINLSSFAEESMKLQMFLRQFVNQYAVDPNKISIDRSVVGNFQGEEVEATSIDIVFQWLLVHHELSLLFDKDHWLIVSKKMLWKKYPYQKLIVSPIKLYHILDELSQLGEITILSDRNHIEKYEIKRNMSYSTIESAVIDLAKQFNLFIEYDEQFHTLYLIDNQLIEINSIQLNYVNQDQVEQFFKSSDTIFNQLEYIKFSFPSEKMLIIKGRQDILEPITTAVTTFDQIHEPELNNKPQNNYFEVILLKSASRVRVQNHLKTVLESDPSLNSELTINYEETEESTIVVVSLYGKKSNVEKVVHIIKKLDQFFQESQSIVVERVDLKYLHVNTKKMKSDGYVISTEGVAAQLRKVFQSALDEKGEKRGLSSLQIIPDFEGNSIILRGSKEQIQFAKQLISVWDKPYPQIRIEAYIFETSDTVSRELGIQFSAQGIPEGGTEPSASGDGIFTAGATLGPLQTTNAFQVDTILRFIESKGKGKVLSRPVLVTSNNVEAEMSSGEVSNVKIEIDGKLTLKEIKTGVILRVTPRLIKEQEGGELQYKIRLKVYAENSSPINIGGEGVFQSNSQIFQNTVVVQSGEPFMIGGLIRRNVSQSETGVPYLKDLPILGWLFKVESNNNRFNHLIVFVTPSLLTDQKQILPDLPGVDNLLEIDKFNNEAPP